MNWSDPSFFLTSAHLPTPKSGFHLHASNPSHLISSHSQLRCSKASLPVLLPSSVLLCLWSILQSELTKVYFITSSSSELVMHFNLFCLPQSLLSSASLYVEVSCRGCFCFVFFTAMGGRSPQRCCATSLQCCFCITVRE